jgi:hypothetical protein
VFALAALSVGVGGLSGCPSKSSHRAPDMSPTCGAEITGEDQLNASVVVLGETHGTREIPAAFAQLVCRAAPWRRGAPVVVGLEIVSSAQAAMNEFLDSDGGSAARQLLLEHEFWQREYQDGRSSEAMLGLLDQLRRFRAAGLGIVVRAIDSPQYGAGDRDAVMTAALIEAIRSVHPSQTLVLVGDVHSRIHEGYPWDPNAAYRSLASQLRTTHGDLIGLHVAASRGSAWTCLTAVAAECGAHALRARESTGPVPRIALDPQAADKVGWSGTLFLERLTASEPARLHASESTRAR